MAIWGNRIQQWYKQTFDGHTYEILSPNGGLSIEKGKDADLIVVDGDPLELKSTIDMVFIDGEEIDTE